MEDWESPTHGFCNESSRHNRGAGGASVRQAPLENLYTAVCDAEGKADPEYLEPKKLKQTKAKKSNQKEQEDLKASKMPCRQTPRNFDTASVKSTSSSSGSVASSPSRRSPRLHSHSKTCDWTRNLYIPSLVLTGPGGSGGHGRGQSRFVGLEGDDLLSDEEKLFRGVSMEALEAYVDRLIEGEEAPDVELYEFRENFRVRGELAIFVTQGTTVMYRGAVGISARVNIYLPGVGDLAVDTELLVPKARHDWTTSDLLEFVMKGHPDDGNCTGAARTRRQGPCLFDSEDLGDPYEGSVVSHMYSTNLVDLVRALAAQFRARGHDLKYTRVWLSLFADVGVEGRMLEQGAILPRSGPKRKRTLRERLAEANARGAAIAAAASKIVGPATTEVGDEEAVDSDDEEFVVKSPARRVSFLGPGPNRGRLSKQRLSNRRTNTMRVSVNEALAASQRRLDETTEAGSDNGTEQRRRAQLFDADLLEAFQRFRDCLLYMASWEEQIEALHDIEFVCELYTISNLKGRRSNLDIVMPRQEYDRYIMFLADDFDGLMQQLFGADQARARAALSVARAEQLHIEIEKLDGGFETLEAAILIWMQDWLLRDLLRNIDAARPKVASLEERQMFADLLSVGARMLNEFGTIDRAHDFLEEALETINHPEAIEEASSRAPASLSQKNKAQRGSTRRAHPDFDESFFLAGRTIGNQRARIQHEMALVRLDLGKYQEALENAQSAVLARRELFGKRTIPVAHSLLVLGLALGSVDRFGDMLTATMQALDIIRAFEGQELGVQTLVADGLRNLAIVHVAENQLDLALSELQQVQTMQLQQLGYLHPALMTTQLQKAAILLDLDLPGRALLRCRDAARIARQRQMSQHPCMARVHSLMGRVCVAQKKLEPAVDRFDKALSIMQASLDDQHPEILATKFWIAEMMRDARPEDALAAHQIILEARQSRLGEASLATGESHHAIGSLLQRLGDPEAARKHMLAALRIRRKWQRSNLPPLNASTRKSIMPCVAESVLELAHIEETLEHNEEAASLYAEHLEFARDAEQLQAEATTAIALAAIWIRDEASLEDAFKLLNSAHDVARKALEATMHQIADASKRKTSPDGASLSVLQIRKIEQGDLCADALSYTSDVHLAKGEFTEALSTAEEAVVIRSKLHGTKSLPVSRLVRKTTDALRGLNRLKDAAARLEKIYSLQKACEDHEFLVGVLMDLAELYFDLGNPTKALARLRDALAIAEANSLSRASILTSLGLQTEDPEQAFEYCEATLRAVHDEGVAAERLSTRRKDRGPDDRSLARIQLRIASYYVDRALFAEVVPHAASALASFKELWDKSPLEDLVELFEASVDLGYAHFRLGHLEDAIQVLQPAIDTIKGAHETRVDLVLWRRAVDTLAQAYFSMESYADALPLLQMAVALRLEQRQRKDAEPFLQDTATAAQALGQIDDFAQALRELVTGYKEQGSHLDLAQTLLRLGHCLFDDVGDVDAGFDSAMNAVAEFEAFKTSAGGDLDESFYQDYLQALLLVINVLEDRCKYPEASSASQEKLRQYQHKFLAIVTKNPAMMQGVASASTQLSYVEYVLETRNADTWTRPLVEEALTFCESAIATFEATEAHEPAARAHSHAAHIALLGSEFMQGAPALKERAGKHLSRSLELIEALHEEVDHESEEEVPDEQVSSVIKLERFVLGRLAYLAREKHDWKKVLELLERAATLVELENDELEIQAEALVELGQYEDALVVLDPLLQQTRKAGGRTSLIARMLRLVATSLEQLERLESDFDHYLGLPTAKKRPETSPSPEYDEEEASESEQGEAEVDNEVGENQTKQDGSQGDQAQGTVLASSSSVPPASSHKSEDLGIDSSVCEEDITSTSQASHLSQKRRASDGRLRPMRNSIASS
ncbi:Hypothetical Protein FCC1311_057882 [Hondaea fermentalgiana]|uniref:Nephrocystin-3 n=1 Tax=Hondaea fermentalgiana TaxID=2315210 RepID=A0A2R5GF94_9STRA|nr:Hypothetical Protein FCC1311_057882 [Hondaea fermentalgiana]|eukprot:GBG29567.1 Hypothetical Protein FCC1311_057882 [Hondaea fermentalgiana]